MKKRIEVLEEQYTEADPIKRIRDIYQLWKEGLSTEDARNRLKPIFAQYPHFQNRPPVSVRKNCYLDWETFTGHKIDL